MRARVQFPAAILLWFCLLTILSARAQTFTNSATLSATVSGTNLLITYSCTTTQGWVTLFAADRPDQLATNARPVDLAPVPPAMSGQFSVPLDAAAPAQFYKLLIEQWPSRGKALVFQGGPLDFAAMRQTYGDITNNSQPSSFPIPTNSTPMIFKQPVEVWLENLGAYDTNGVLVSGNDGKVIGKYAEGDVLSINNPGAGYPPFGVLVRPDNDFHVNYAGDASVSAREAVIWSSEVQLYYDLNDYRTRFLNGAFIDELDLPPEIATNLKHRQYRPDLNLGSSPTPRVPLLRAIENNVAGGIGLFPIGNAMNVNSRTRGPGYPDVPLSIAYDTGLSMGDYLGLVAFWVLGTNTGFPPESFWGEITDGSWRDWRLNMLPALNDGISAWGAYRYSGDPEIYSYAYYAVRIWGGRPCGGTNIPCDKAEDVRNVMMFDEANTSKDGVFPYTTPTWISTSGNDGPNGSDLACLYIAAIFYDLANDAGLGMHKADLLIWKTLSLITNNVTFPMRAFGAKVQEAARALWPDPRPGRAGLSRYEEDVADVLTSRGIPLNGVADFRTNLPVAIGKFPETLDVTSTSGFGSGHPNSQPNANSYGAKNIFDNGYTQTNATGQDYVAYQFYKHSKYGPCDKLALTDGTFTVVTGPPVNWYYNSNGTYYLELTDRELGNLVLLAPSNHIRFMTIRQRCPNEATGFYAEDVRPFGFRVIQATPNGFSFTASSLSETTTNKTYQLTIVDPSVNTLGAASYAWSFTNHLGTAESAAGSLVQYTATKDEPFTLSITRTRANITNTLTLRERGNDLDRNSGQAFVRNLVP